MRSSPIDLERSAIEALVETWRHVGLDALRVDGSSDAAHDLVLVLPWGDVLPVDVKARAIADPASLPPKPSGRLVIVVADVVTSRVRAALRERRIGWLDRRGHLRLDVPGLLIETDVPPLPREVSEGDEVPADAFGRGRATVEVALALLLEPADPPGIREIARTVDLAPSTVSQAHGRLRRASLITSEGHPLLPELFWELAERWRPNWYHLASFPGTAPLGSTDAGGPGWVRTGDVAAALFGAPLVVGSLAPGLYYVASPTELRQARRVLGDTDPADAACRVAVAPSRWVFARADDATGSKAAPSWTAFPLAPYVVVALDLARDPSRGREILEAWTQTPDGRAPVWRR